MATRVTDLDPILGSNLSADDEVHVVDVSDVSDHPDGSSFSITLSELINYVSANIADLTVSGSFVLDNDEMSIGRFLRHKDDSDTYMNMISNGIYFRAGGNGDNLVMTSSATILNSSGTDKDTIIESLDYSNAFIMDASANTATFNGEEFRVNEFNTSGLQLGSFYMNNGDFFIQSLSGGDMLQLVDAGATNDINANPYQEWHRSNGIGASLVRLGYFGFASTSNPDIWIKNEVTHGDIVFRTDNNVGIRINDENDKIHLESRDIDFSNAAFNGTHTFTFYGGGGNQSTNPIHQIDFHNLDSSGAERVQAQIKTMPVYSGGHGIHMDFHVGDSSAAPARAMRLEGSTGNVIVDNGLNVSGNFNVTNPAATNGLTFRQFANGNAEIDNEDGGSILIRVSNSSNLAVTSGEVVINEDSNSGVDFRVETDSYTHAFFVDAYNDSAKFNIPVEIEAENNLTTTYPLEISNNANNYGISIGAYGMSNKVYGSANISYTVDIGDNLYLKVGDDCFIENDAEGWSHVFSNGDLILRGVNGGDMFQMVDAGATTATDCLAYGEIHYANSIGASNTRVGIWGFASTNNQDFYLWNYTNGGFRFGCNGNTGVASFQLDEIHVKGASGASLILQDNAAAANNGIFDFRVDEGLLRGRIRNDAHTEYSNWLRVYTSNHTQIDEIELNSNNVDVRGNLQVNNQIKATKPGRTLELEASIIDLDFNHTSQALDEKRWRYSCGTSSINFQTVNDAYTAASQIFSVNRSGQLPTEFKIYPELKLDNGVTFDNGLNNLDIYEENETLTLSVKGDITAGTPVYNIRDCYYTRIGDQVTVCFDLDITLTGVVGTLIFTGLPYRARGDDFAAAFGPSSGFNGVAQNHYMNIIATSSQAHDSNGHFFIRITGANNRNLEAADVSSTIRLTCTLVYLTQE